MSEYGRRAFLVEIRVKIRYTKKEKDDDKGVTQVNRKKILITAAAVAVVSIIPLSVQAQEAEVLTTAITNTEKADKKQYSIAGNIKVKKSSEIYNVNPYNPQSITATAAGGKLSLISPYETIELSLSAPLFKLSEIYRDKIISKDGVWGAERNVRRRIFDGSENWQLVLEKKYTNDNTTIFVCDLGEKALIKEGISTHFDTMSDKAQRTNIYDGISISTDGTKCYVRIMNVRNVKTVEALKQYLQTQKDNQNPVTFLYAAPKTTFEPFSEEIQKQLNQLDFTTIGFTDTTPPSVYVKEELEESKVFQYKQEYIKEEEQLSNFIKSVKNIMLYNAEKGGKYFIESISVEPTANECIIQLAKETGTEEKKSTIVSKAVFSFYDCDFMSGKLTEILFEEENQSGIKAVAQIDFSKFKIPSESKLNLTYDQLGLSDFCIAEKELILPKKMPVVIGSDMNVYYDNILFNGELGKKDFVTATEGRGENKKDHYHFDTNQLSQAYNQQFVLKDGADKAVTATTQVIPIAKEAGEGITKKVMFLGDSLINQNYLTQAVLNLFEEDDMNIELVGTRGEEGNKHEGRGGWSAFDYCRAEKQYGEPNPFLKRGKFDFSYFMEQNEFQELDTVFISLGVNDLNQMGSDKQPEILKYFDAMIASIRKFNPDMDILIGIPPMLFAKESTFLAKNTRLSFVKSLKERYEDREKEGIYLVPLYTNIDPFMSFKFEEPVITADNPSGAMMVTDTTHPRIKGYEQMAEVIYCYLKYIEAQ